MNSGNFYDLWNMESYLYLQTFGCFWLTLNATEPDEPNKYHQFEINIWFQDIATNRFIFSRNTKFVDELFAFVEEEIYE
jgi:hypothetical protein